MTQDVKEVERSHEEAAWSRASRRGVAMKFTGMNLREGLTLFMSLGGVVEGKRRTGELRLRHPRLSKAVVVSCRRKDCPRPMTVALRRLSVA